MTFNDYFMIVWSVWFVFFVLFWFVWRPRTLEILFGAQNKAERLARGVCIVSIIAGSVVDGAKDVMAIDVDYGAARTSSFLLIAYAIYRAVAYVFRQRHHAQAEPSTHNGDAHPTS